MCTVYEFPTKVKLPKQIEERLFGLAWDYVDALYNALDDLCEDNANYEEMEEVGKLVSEVFTQGLDKAIDEYEDGLE